MEDLIKKCYMRSYNMAFPAAVLSKNEQKLLFNNKLIAESTTRGMLFFTAKCKKSFSYIFTQTPDELKLESVK